MKVALSMYDTLLFIKKGIENGQTETALAILDDVLKQMKERYPQLCDK